MVLSWIFTVRPALTATAPAAKADVLDGAAVIVSTAGSAPKQSSRRFSNLSVSATPKTALDVQKIVAGGGVVKSRLNEAGARERRDLPTGSTLAASLSSSGRRPRLIPALSLVRVQRALAGWWSPSRGPSDFHSLPASGNANMRHRRLPQWPSANLRSDRGYIFTHGRSAKHRLGPARSSDACRH